jgi:predicted lipoprotein with Yx(FWY)xxD motif
MRRAALQIRNRASIPILALLALAALAAAPAGAGARTSASASATRKVVKEAENSTLGKTILTNNSGRTLYSLSVEKKGKFICTGSCLSVWHPLTVPAGVTPEGPVKLGTVKRPDGRTQVTYKGLPLYRFGGDTKSGEVNGEGIKDVGTWHAATAPSAKSSEPPTEQSPPSSPNPSPGNPYGY